MSHDTHKTMGRHDECRAALGQLLEQVYQMQGMFPNDEELELAIQDAEDALEQ